MSEVSTQVQVNEYRKFHWMSGRGTIRTQRTLMMEALKTLAAVEHFENKYRELINQSMTNPFDLAFPQMKAKTIHRADVAKRAALRMKMCFNNLISEIQL